MPLPEGLSLSALFLAALLSSFHCAGMCGGFVLACGGGPSAREVLKPQLLYHAGKGFTYVFLGALASAAGAGFLSRGSLEARWLSIAGALLFVWAGWRALWPSAGKGAAPSLAHRAASFAWRGLGSGLISLRSPLAPLYLGAFSALMPCALVYAFVAEAAGRGGFLESVLVMSLLELGTLPALIAVALGGFALPPALRLRLARASGVFLILLGLWSCYRGWASPPCCSVP